MAPNLPSADLFFLFYAPPPKSFNKPFEFLLYKTNRLHFPVCVYCNRPQKTPQRVNIVSRIEVSGNAIKVFVLLTALKFTAFPDTLILETKGVFTWRRASPLGSASPTKKAGFHLAFT